MQLLESLGLSNQVLLVFLRCHPSLLVLLSDREWFNILKQLEPSKLALKERSTPDILPKLSEKKAAGAAGLAKSGAAALPPLPPQPTRPHHLSDREWLNTLKELEPTYTIDTLKDLGDEMYLLLQDFFTKQPQIPIQEKPHTRLYDHRKQLLESLNVYIDKSGNQVSFIKDFLRIRNDLFHLHDKELTNYHFGIGKTITQITLLIGQEVRAREFYQCVQRLSSKSSKWQLPTFDSLKVSTSILMSR